MIPQELGEQMERLAGFRNALVHVYWRPDFDAVHRILQEGCNPLRAFCRVVKQLLEIEEK